MLHINQMLECYCRLPKMNWIDSFWREGICERKDGERMAPLGKFLLEVELIDHVAVSCSNDISTT